METWEYGGTSVFWRPVRSLPVPGSSLEASGRTEIMAGALTGSCRQRGLLLESTASSKQDRARREYCVFDWPTRAPRRVVSLGSDSRGVVTGEVDEDSWTAG